MFHIHKWSKWERVEMERFYPRLNEWVEVLTQERKCGKCGKIQNEQI